MGGKGRQIALLVFAALFAAMAAAYYLYLVPLQERETGLQMRLDKMKHTLTQMQNPMKMSEQQISQQVLVKLQEAIPVKPYADQLIKDLDKLQSLSQITIEEASFSEKEQLSAQDLADQLVYTEKEEEKEEQETKETETDANKQDAVVEESSSTESAAVEQQKKADSITNEQRQIKQEIIERYLPEANFNSIDIILKIKGNYEEIYSFVTELQKISRYLRVDHLEFKTNQKQEFVIPEDAQMSATVKLTSYFAPQFEKHVDKLPVVQVEGPSDKWNPLQYEAIKKTETPFSSNE